MSINCSVTWWALLRSGIILLTADCSVSANTGMCLSVCSAVIVFLGAVRKVKSGVLGVRKATSVRHCTDGEEISQGKETHPRISAQVLYMMAQKNKQLLSDLVKCSPIFILYPVQRKVLCENYNSWLYLKIVVTVCSKAIFANYMLSKHTKSKVVMKVIFEDIF